MGGVYFCGERFSEKVLVGFIMSVWGQRVGLGQICMEIYQFRDFL